MGVQRVVIALNIALLSIGGIAFAQKGVGASQKPDPNAKPSVPMVVEYVYVGPRNPALYTPWNGDFRPAEGNQTVHNVTGVPSWDALGNANNVRRSINVGADNLWNGIGWEVTISAYGGSWLSEVAVLVTNVNGEGYVLRPGAGNNASGTGTFSSNGVLKLCSGFGLRDIPLPDNTLYLEFYETVDDYPGAQDGNWDSGTITFQTTIAPPFTGWDETENGGGDAGDTPETAQNTVGNSIPAIRGTLDADDVDIYAIYIEDPSVFSASTRCGAGFDTQLWLFDSEGKGVVFNDDAPGGGFQSIIDNSTGCIQRPGLYYLAISRYNRDAFGCDVGLIWNNTPFRAIRCPDGPEATSRLGFWSGSTASAGTYVIYLTGVSGATRNDPADCPPPAPWDEFYYGGGDAGDLPATAQKVTLPNRQPCQDPVNRIRGDHEADGVDMYVICITDPNSFVASTIGGATWDTQLWLFRCDGTGVVANDDTDGLQSRIDNSLGCITEPGIYLLAISRFNRDAVDANGNLLWSSGALSCADNPNPIAGWTGTTLAGGIYSISLQGAYFVSSAGCEGGGSPCQGDVNGDRIVDDADLLIVLFNFGQSGFNVPGDVNSDGIVDDADLLIVLFNFGCSG